MSDNLKEGEMVNNPNSWVSNEGHPLLNPVVASTLFEVVTLPQLRTLRLVCKDWYSVSLPIWRRTVQINIRDQSPNQRLLQWKSLGTELDVGEEKPFRNYRLQLPKEENFEGTCRNMERFWAIYGHWIHKLELGSMYVKDWGAFKRAVFEQTPNLQELILNKVFDGRVQSSNPTPTQVQANQHEGRGQPNLNLNAFAVKDRSKFRFGWRLFFTRFPNIQKLQLPEPDRNSNDIVEGLEDMLVNPDRRPNLPITDLRLEINFDFAVEKLLRNPLVKLKVLHLGLRGGSSKNLDILQTALHHHGNTLKELHLQSNIMSNDFWESVVGPYISLTELQVKGSALAPNFHFLDKFPNLKVLRLEQEDDHVLLKGTKWTSLKGMPLLREFYFIATSERGSLSEEMLERLAEVMPNLESFTGQLTNQTLRVVCRNWRKLKKLVILSVWWCFDGWEPHVYYYYNYYDFEECYHHPGVILDIDDDSITGIVSGSNERVHCVADLQELRHLTLENVTSIGNVSVFDGFLKLPNLSSLNICGANWIGRGLEPLKRRLQEGLTITPFFDSRWNSGQSRAEHFAF